MTGFTGGRVDRADHLRLDPVAIAALAAHPDARMMRLSGLLPGTDGTAISWIKPDRPADGLIFLGLDQGRPLFVPIADDGPPAPLPDAMALAARLSGEETALWGGARSLIVWHARHGFCPNCGQPTHPFRGGWGRRCGGCNAEHYPRVDPVVIMLAEHGGAVLIARQPRFPAGRYSALAGFVEPGESIEEAVARELREEAALPVTHIRYVASQPWPFPHSLMIACIAQASTRDVTLDGAELEDSMWVDRAGVAAALAGRSDAPFIAPPRIAIAHTLLRHWLAGGDGLA
jgi:NAD+ diphosphatase